MHDLLILYSCTIEGSRGVGPSVRLHAKERLQAVRRIRRRLRRAGTGFRIEFKNHLSFKKTNYPPSQVSPCR